MKEKQEKKKNLILGFLTGLYRFFIPKNFKDEMLRGKIIGDNLKEKILTPKISPSWWLGKGLRKVIDPKHKMNIGKKEEK
jgi:hypothetical protein